MHQAVQLSKVKGLWDWIGKMSPRGMRWTDHSWGLRSLGMGGHLTSAPRRIGIGDVTEAVAIGQ